MKITRLRTDVVRLPIDPPVRAAIFELRTVDAVLTTLETDQGVVGEGLVFTVNGRNLQPIRAMVESLAPLVAGLDPTLGATLHARAATALNWVGYEGISVIGLSAVDMAVWDLRGKAAGLNLARLIGACRTAVPTYASGGLWLSASIDALQREAAAFVARGFRAVKTRVEPGNPARMVARVRAVREAIGPDVALMVDANQQLGVSEAIRLGRMLEELNLAWFEEPVLFTNHAGEAAVAAALDTPIASGETVYMPAGVRRMLEARAADVLMPDLQRMGGPTGFLKAASLCEAFHMPFASHIFTEMSLPLLATMPNAIYLEHMPWLEPLYGSAVELDEAGRAIVPDKPGFGFSFDPAAVRRFAV